MLENKWFSSFRAEVSKCRSGCFFRDSHRRWRCLTAKAETLSTLRHYARFKQKTLENKAFDRKNSVEKVSDTSPTLFGTSAQRWVPYRPASSETEPPGQASRRSRWQPTCPLKKFGIASPVVSPITLWQTCHRV